MRTKFKLATMIGCVFVAWSSSAYAEFYRSAEEAHAALQNCWVTRDEKNRIYSDEARHWYPLWSQRRYAELQAHYATRRQLREIYLAESRRCTALSDLVSELRSRARAAARAAVDEERQRAPDRAVTIATRFMPSETGSSVLGAYRNVQSGLGTAQSLLSNYRAMTSGDAGQQSATAIGWVQSLSGMAGGPMAGYREVGFRAVQGLHNYAQSQFDSAFTNFDRDMAGSSGGGYQYALNAGFRPMLAARNQPYGRLEDAVQQLQQGEAQLLPEQTVQLAALMLEFWQMQEMERRAARARSEQGATPARRETPAAHPVTQPADPLAAALNATAVSNAVSALRGASDALARASQEELGRVRETQAAALAASASSGMMAPAPRVSAGGGNRPTPSQPNVGGGRTVTPPSNASPQEACSARNAAARAAGETRTLGCR
jgi:hypothetical protein